MDIKKIGMVLATIVITIIRLPISLIAALFVGADSVLIKLVARLANGIGAEWWRETLYEAQDININMGNFFAQYFVDLQEDLA